MKTAITGDWQFDEAIRYSHVTPSGITSRLEDAIKCLRWMVDTATEADCTHLIFLGDFFHSRTAIDVSVLHEVGSAVSELAMRFERVDMLVGNHDAYLRAPEVTSLSVFRGIPNVHIWSTPGFAGDFAFVPWVQTEEAFRQAVVGLKATANASVLCAHAMFAGAVPMASGWDPAILDPPHWSQVWLGDVHEPVKLGANIQYAGAPMQHHYGDANGRRGFWIFDRNAMAKAKRCTFVENTVSPRFHLLSEPGAVSEVRSGDFVRAVSESPDVAARIVEKAIALGAVAESNIVEIEETAPRIAMAPSDPHEVVLKRYMTHQGMADVEGLLEDGLSILEEAGGVA